MPEQVLVSVSVQMRYDFLKFMSRLSRYALFLILPLALLLAAPASAHAATATFFGPIVAEECHCPGSAPSYGCVLATVQNTINFGISLACILAALALAYAGLMWVVNSTNPEGRKQASGMLLNVFVGLVIVLSAWLIIDFVMKKLYAGEHGSKDFGPWNSILAGQAGDQCIVATTPSGGGILGGILGGPPPAPPAGAGTTFTYQSGVQAETPAESSALRSLLSCMSGRLPSGVGQISAVTDLYSVTDQSRIAHCAAVGSQGDSHCAHTVGSCHYGGSRCTGQSYAVDFGDEGNASALIAAARACGAQRAALENGTHVHVSAPNQCGASGACN